MTTSDVTGVYARTLFDLASAADAVDAADEGLAAIVEAVKGSIELREALSDTAIPGDKKRDIMRDLFAGSVSSEAVAVASVVVERAGADALADVHKAYRQIAEAERGIVVAEVTTAVALTDENRASLIDKLSSALRRPVSLRERVDGSIVGGIRINVAGRVLDGSIASQLDAMRAALSNASQGGEA